MGVKGRRASENRLQFIHTFCMKGFILHYRAQETWIPPYGEKSSRENTFTSLVVWRVTNKGYFGFLCIKYSCCTQDATLTFLLTVTEARWSAHLVKTSPQSFSERVPRANQAAVRHSPYVWR